MKIDRLLLTTDFSPCARAAYVGASDLALRHRARIDLVHVLDRLGNLIRLNHETSEVTRQNLQRRQYRRTLDESADPAFTDVPVETCLLAGGGADAVCRRADDVDADLIVLSSHGYSGIKQFLLGSFAQRVLHHASVPVLVFKPSLSPRRGEGGFRPRRILFPCDFSPLSFHALDAIRFFARSCDAEVRVTCVSKPPSRGSAGVREHPVSVLERLRSMATHELGDIQHACRELHGDPPAKILEEAELADVDLICMATHGWTGLRRMLIGSVADTVVRRAPCPVLTVRPSRENLAISTEFIMDPRTFLAGWPPQ